jgi:eukaryotic-like serine/threonine-protein kinase
MSPPQEQDPGIARLDPMPGRVIGGNFRIDKLIGAGAMGNVYKALQVSLNKPVAVKILHFHLHRDERLVARFKREAKSASLLNHPNSIQIIDSGEDSDGTLYIAMELLTGRDLAQVIRDDFPLPLLRIGRIMSQVFNALDEAHAQGVIHRDLKPSNIMLIERRGEKDFVKVCDYGIAKATLGDGEDDRSAMLTVQGLVCGTPEYMSPEQARAEPLDGRADLYSAAVILYQLVTGDIPFRAGTAMGIISRHLAEPPEPPSRRRRDLNIPAGVDQIVLRGLEKDRELRFDNAIAFRDAIDTMLNLMGVAHTPLPPSVRASMPTARDMAGSPTPIDTATVPMRGAENRFGTTADLTGRSGTRQKILVLLGTAILLGGSAAGAIVTARARRAQMTAGNAPAAGAAPAAAPVVAAPPPVEARAPIPPSAPAAAAAVPIPEAPAEAHAPPNLRDSHGKRRAAASRAVVVSSAVPGGVAADGATAKAVPPAPTPAPEATPTPAARGMREVLAEAEKLLGQGEVGDACARGEEANHLAPKAPQVHKFLGKCYMRAGRTREANDNYKQYLELAPNAPDAPFVKSMIK